MSEFIWLYLYTLLLKTGGAATGMLILGIIATIAAGVALGLTKIDYPEFSPPKWATRSLVAYWIVVAFFGTCAFVTPSKSDLAWIIGGGVAWNVAQNEEVQKLPENLARMANDFMKSANDPNADGADQ